MSTRTLGAFLCLALVTNAAQAGPVFLDYTDFDTRLGELATSAGVAAFSAGEQSTIEMGIKSGLESIYSAFSGLSFTDVSPGGTFATINFGLTATPGALGVADHIDFLNRDLGDTARVFSGNFGFIVESFEPRATQIAELTAALTGTAAHELGHNLGLRHHDAYGDLEYTGTPIATGGAQNTHVMATGSTGLGEVGRETERDFSLNSIVKLEYADGTLAVNPTAIAEAGDAGATAGTAQTVVLESLPVSGRVGEVVIGTLSSGADVDVFRLDGITGTLTADINVDYDGGTPFTNVNSFIEILDSTFTVIASDDVSAYAGNTYGSGGFGDGFDPALFNVPITDGTYYVRVTVEGGGGGDYQLLVHADAVNDTPAVPEPTSLALLGIGAAFGFVSVGRRRRRNAA